LSTATGTVTQLLYLNPK